MRLASLLAKVSDIRSYCDSQANSCIITGVNYVTENKAAYNTALDEMATAIADYYSQAYNAAREKQLNELIMTMYQTSVMSYLAIGEGNVSLILPDPGTAPTGYEDYTLLFDMGAVGTDLLATPTSSFWDGCQIAPITEPEVSLPTIYAFVDRCKAAEATDSQARNALINWAKLTNISNAYIFLFEEVTTVDNRPANLKRSIGEDMFVTKRGAELIRYYGFDVYIPSYIP